MLKPLPMVGAAFFDDGLVDSAFNWTFPGRVTVDNMCCVEVLGICALLFE